MSDYEDEVKCSDHPLAPHGFNRDASHALGRYVCDCEGWTPDQNVIDYENKIKADAIRDFIARTCGTGRIAEWLMAEADKLERGE